ncbi:prolipoprotein diacylglyceryl transferase [Acholeplasma hippikon]|uniref:Phosphatidylglycerol--prolipoprotein diacylglyceryl transferase n=1 Tax=Acholeplasma hippikon TaxID=264636 RepID=A0A449BKZ7_9MOLU|nr:prolipoprotein diacylglyceryl transferase [Acholeplasma hippikon]VEU83102.1 Pyrophosphatase ppaX [Acholeplasma hippikon]
MKSSFKKYQNYIVFGGFALVFMFLVFIATFNQVERAKAGGGWDSTFNVPGLPVAWYAVFIMVGIIFATILGYLEFKRAEQDPEILWDGLLIFVFVGILGARLWYVFSDILRSITEGTLANNDFIKNPLLIIGYNGSSFELAGLAIHGGIIFVFIGLIFFTRRRKISYWFMLDIVAPGFLIGQAMGRWGNFMNRELYGPVMNNANWLPAFIRERMDFGAGVYNVNTGTPEYHHPTFLYESLWNLVGLIIILAFRHKKKFRLGDMLAFYLVWYGVGRIPTETLRILESSLSGEPLSAGGVSISILTSIGLIIAGLLVFFLKRKYQKNLPYYDEYGKKAVLFDLDGTLLDTLALIKVNTRETFKKFLPNINLSDDELKAFFGPTLHESFSWYEKDPKKIEQMVTFYRERNRINHHELGVKGFPHAYEALEALKNNGYLIGVVSSKKKEFVELGLEQNDLLKFVDVVVGSDDVNKHKPHPEPILKALEILNVTKENATYVGDHANDVLAAKACGMRAIGVSYSIHYRELLAAKPDIVIDDLEKLLKIF